MGDNKLRQPADPLYQLLREGRAEEFNRKRNPPEPFDLHSCNLRGVDLSVRLGTRIRTRKL
ncbi:MAG: hypothetical protein ACHQIL_01245 [Steroidobacterales bacterium]